MKNRKLENKTRGQEAGRALPTCATRLLGLVLCAPSIAWSSILLTVGGKAIALFHTHFTSFNSNMRGGMSRHFYIHPLPSTAGGCLPFGREWLATMIGTLVVLRSRQWWPTWLHRAKARRSASASLSERVADAECLVSEQGSSAKRGLKVQIYARKAFKRL